MQLPRLAPESRMDPHTRRIWAVYGAVFVVLAVVHAVRGDSAQWGVVARDYWPATWRWWSRSGDLYTEGIAGFLYLPQSVWLFTPFAYLPFQLDHVLWRLFGLALLAIGLRRVLCAARPDRVQALWFVATLLVLPCAFSASNTGQSNVHLAGFLLLACADMQEERFRRASLWLWLAMLAKPVALVPILLCGALQPQMRKSLALGALAFALLPYLHPDWGFVTTQYGLAFEKLRAAGDPGEKVYANLVWLVQSLGVSVPKAVRTALQLGLALATLWVCARAYRRGGARQGAWFLMAFAASYMMLLSPRTETNTYVVLVPFVACVAAIALLVLERRGAFLGFSALCLLLASDNFGRAFHGWTSPWLKPVVALLFAGWLVGQVRRLPRTDLWQGETEA